MASKKGYMISTTGKGSERGDPEKARPLSSVSCSPCDAIIVANHSSYDDVPCKWSFGVLLISLSPHAIMMTWNGS